MQLLIHACELSNHKLDKSRSRDWNYLRFIYGSERGTLVSMLQKLLPIFRRYISKLWVWIVGLWPCEIVSCEVLHDIEMTARTKRTAAAFCVSVRLTHWGRVTHICAGNLTIIGSDNGLSPGRRQAIIWTNDRILLIRTLRTKFSEILSEIHAFSFKKMPLKVSFVKRRPFCLGLNVLRLCGTHLKGDGFCKWTAFTLFFTDEYCSYAGHDFRSIAVRHGYEISSYHSMGF